MFEISYDDEAKFCEYCETHHVYKGSQYVFTFDNRFLIYYYKRREKYDYIALDTTTGLGSEFVTTDYKYKKNEFDTLVPKILNAIKYTGELRYLSAQSTQPKPAQEEPVQA